MNVPRTLRPAIQQKGSVLVISLLVLTVLSLLALAILGMSLTEGNISTNWRNQTQAFYAAEAGAESGVSSLRTLLGGTPSPTDAQLSAIVSPALSDPKYSFASFQVQRVRPTPYQTKIDHGSYQGLTGFSTDYQIAAQASGPRGTRAGVTQVLQYMQVPLFQFGVFYGKGVDLEMAPGQAMTFNGRVHANSSIYLRNDAAAGSMKFNSYMTTAGTINRYIKRDGSSVHNDNPMIADQSGTFHAMNFDHSTGLDFGGSWSENSWKSTALSTFQGMVQDKSMGVQEITPPIPDLFNNPSNPDQIAHQLIEKSKPSDSPALSAAKLYNQAGLRIVNGVATDKNGNTVTLPAGVISTKNFYDKREGATITVTEVNIAALRTSGVSPSNGILYVTNDSTNNSVRLVNGSQLPTSTDGGFTVVSEKPVYIQGDYNTTNKVAAAVMADAVTILSNNWQTNNSDAKGDQTTSNRPASATSVNAAFALGPSVESTTGQGNGQLENVIRFLEDWGSTRTFTYSGSLVSLWHSQHAQGTWGGGYYNPPRRVWSYDTLFNNQQPPGAPRGIFITKGRWSQL
ncbi:MAG TPA: PilX N-terminal domain-containing pilus assembly protein [Candidatus Acidoferrum sp.]|nr:PilX N-terminal domain-containing pilus assembly protein [Candidatus Acidoferrum sp.]